MKIVLIAAALVALGAPAMAGGGLSVEGEIGKTKAKAAGGAQSASGAGGISVGPGIYVQGAGNSSNAGGLVDARNGKSSSTVTQLYHTDSASLAGGLSNGHALGGAVAGGGSEAYGNGLAVQRTGKVSIKTHY